MSLQSLSLAPQRQAVRATAASGRTWFAPLGLVLSLVAIWEVGTRAADVPSYVLPPPSEIAGVVLTDPGLLAGHAVATATTALIGLAIGTLAGLLLAGALATWQPARAAVLPLLVVSQSIPMVVLAPVLVVWFGFGLLPRVLVVALVCFFPIALSATAGLLAADRDQVALVRSMGAGRLTVARHVSIPGAMPSVFTGLKLAGAYAMFGAIVGEWIGASSGLGIYIERSRASYATDQVFAGVAVIAGISVLLFLALSALERRATPWRHVEATQPLQETP